MQTVDDLVHSMGTAVRAGRYAPGDPLPSVRALAAERHCSAGTAARAYLRLRAAG
ncbi:MAG: GntR family transcriptional regulator, partial [Nocardioidaceae bacterium]|nr:GntR family transcriptional regulator [Nocardioidaceae bacterium]